MDDVCLVPILIGVGVLALVIYFGWQSANNEAANQNNLQNQLRQKKFKIDKTYNIISLGVNKQVLFDFESNKIAILDAAANSINYVEFNKIIDCEILEDNTTIMKGGIGRALVGGVLAGGVGAIVGAGTRGLSDIVKNLAIRIITNDISNPMVMITLINSDTKRDGLFYKNCMASAQEIYSTIVSVLNSGKTSKQTLSESIDSESVSDQIRELAKLKGEGLLTEEEFNKKKKALLNID